MENFNNNEKKSFSAILKKICLILIEKIRDTHKEDLSRSEEDSIFSIAASLMFVVITTMFIVYSVNIYGPADFLDMVILFVWLIGGYICVFLVIKRKIRISKRKENMTWKMNSLIRSVLRKTGKDILSYISVISKSRKTSSKTEVMSSHPTDSDKIAMNKFPSDKKHIDSE